MKISPVVGENLPCDRHREASSRFLGFCKHGYRRVVVVVLVEVVVVVRVTEV